MATSEATHADVLEAQEKVQRLLASETVEQLKKLESGNKYAPSGLTLHAGPFRLVLYFLEDRF